MEREADRQKDQYICRKRGDKQKVRKEGRDKRKNEMEEKKTKTPTCFEIRGKLTQVY